MCAVSDDGFGFLKCSLLEQGLKRGELFANNFGCCLYDFVKFLAVGLGRVSEPYSDRKGENALYD